MTFSRFACLGVCWLSLVAGGTTSELVAAAAEPTLARGFQLATFSADVTIPLGHRCMGILPTKSQRIADPLYAHGFVLLGGGEPIVLCAVDWCEIRNGAYDQWRDALAEAAGTCEKESWSAPCINTMHRWWIKVRGNCWRRLGSKESCMTRSFTMLRCGGWPPL